MKVFFAVLCMHESLVWSSLVFLWGGKVWTCRAWPRCVLCSALLWVRWSCCRDQTRQSCEALLVKQGLYLKSYGALSHLLRLLCGLCLFVVFPCHLSVVYKSIYTQHRCKKKSAAAVWAWTLSSKCSQCKCGGGEGGWERCNSSTFYPAGSLEGFCSSNSDLSLSRDGNPSPCLIWSILTHLGLGLKT